MLSPEPSVEVTLFPASDNQISFWSMEVTQEYRITESLLRLEKTALII